jgi:CRP/FNR family cyclic AMP-dependent transcriptional regulator
MIKMRKDETGQAHHKEVEISKKGLRLSIPALKYFWQSSLLGSRASDNIPQFLRHLDIFSEFSVNELRILSQSMHFRFYETKELVFRQGERGAGFYFVVKGEVLLVAPDEPSGEGESYYLGIPEKAIRLILKKNGSFGELALIQENNIRSVDAIASMPSMLLGIFRPDLENLIRNEPVVAAKFLQSLLVILGARISALTADLQNKNAVVKELKNKVKHD